MRQALSKQHLAHRIPVLVLADMAGKHQLATPYQTQMPLARSNSSGWSRSHVQPALTATRHVHP
jgi:hypothetical protein